MKKILSEIPMAGVMLDRNGVIEFCNDSLLDMSGHSREDVLGSCWFETFVPARKRAGRKAEYLLAMKSGILRKRYEGMILSRAGGEIGVMWNCAVIRDGNGNPVSTVKLGLGIAEEGVCRSEEIHRLRKYERIGRSAAGLLHDLNNLHCLILGYSQMITQNMPTYSSSCEYFSGMDTAIKKGKALSKQLLALIKGNEHIELTDLNLRNVVEDFKELMHGMIDGNNITLKTELYEHSGSIRGNREQIERILLNLLMNACDSMPEGGEVWIKLSETVFKEPVSCRGSEITPGQYALLSFSDSGHGIAEEILGHIFEPFFTTKKNGTGFALQA